MAPAASAQTPDSAVVSIHVVDTAGVGVPRARIFFSIADSAVRLDQTDLAGNLVRRLEVLPQPYHVSVLSIGYVSTRRLLRLTPDEPSTLQLTLVRVQPDTVASLPTVTTEASRRRGPADTLPELERSGFYERRYEGYAPQPSFVTAEQISHWNITRLKDIKSIARNIDPTTCTTYLNGSWITVNESVLSVGDLAGVEVYSSFETPVMYPAHAGSGCVALFWLK